MTTYCMGVDQRQFDTILAALRAFQESPWPKEIVEAIAKGDHGFPLDENEIYDLCEYMNPQKPEFGYEEVEPGVFCCIPLDERPDF